MKKACRRTLFVLALVLCLYIGSYVVISFSGKHDRIGISGAGESFRALWTFGGCRQQAHEYTSDQDSEFYSPESLARERRLMRLYYPLVWLDRARGYYHLLDDDLPETGG